MRYRFFFFKQKTAYEMRISDWSSDVCSSDLHEAEDAERNECHRRHLAELDETADRQQSEPKHRRARKLQEAGVRRAEIYDRKRKSGNDVSAAEKGATGDEADNEPEREMRVPQYTEVDQRPALLNADLPGDEKRKSNHTTEPTQSDRLHLAHDKRKNIRE